MTKKRTSTRRVRRDARYTLPCEFPGCPLTRCAKGLCHQHWKQARLSKMSQQERRAFYRRAHNKLPAPTRDEPGRCECCGRALKSSGDHTEVPQLDHDHATWTFRGWLCRNCNVGIGLLGDTLDGLLKAVQYLQNSELL